MITKPALQSVLTPYISGYQVLSNVRFTKTALSGQFFGECRPLTLRFPKCWQYFQTLQVEDIKKLRKEKTDLAVLHSAFTLSAESIFCRGL